MVQRVQGCKGKTKAYWKELSYHRIRYRTCNDRSVPPSRIAVYFYSLKTPAGCAAKHYSEAKKKKKKSITMSWAQIVNLCNTAGFSAITHHRVFSSCCNHTSYVLRKGMLRQQENCKATYLPLFLPQWREALQTLPGHWQDTNQSLPLLLYRHWQWPLKEALKWKLSARGLKLLLILLCIDLWHAPTLAQSRRS